MFRILIYIFLSMISVVLIGQTRTSVASGSFTTPGIWDCTCVPSNTESIIIGSTHTITLPGNRTVNNVEIKSGGVLNNLTRRIIITGNYIVNGEHTGSTGDTRLTGINTIIDGSGIISNRNLEIRTGDKTILSTADLEKTTSGQVLIRGALTVTNNGIFRSTRNINGNNANSTWTNAANSVLDAGRNLMTTGILNAGAIGNEVIYSRNGNQEIEDPASSTFYHLTLDGSNNKSLNANVIILGDLSIKGGNLRTRSNDIMLAGDFTNSGGSFQEQLSQITFNGTSNQTITAGVTESFYDFEVNKASGDLILGVDVTVLNNLILNGGLIITGSNKITLGSSTTVIGSLTLNTDYVFGNFERWLNATGINYLFPIGTSANYRPLFIDFNNLTAGRLLISFNETTPGDNGLSLYDVSDSIHHAFTEGYWEASNSSGLSSNSFNLELIANGFTSYTIDPTTRILTRANSSSSWTANGTHFAASTPSVYRNTVTQLPAEFSLGDTTRCTIPSPSTSSITGLNSTCINTNSVSYSVINTAGAVYNWTITGGSQVSGGSTNAITLNWGGTGMTGEVKVVEYNGCEYGSPVSLAVDIHPLPADSISGLSVVEENMNGVSYAVTATTGYTYNWTIIGGTKASGGTTSSITVNWGSAGTGKVSVTATNNCGTSSAVELDVDIIAFIKSVASTAWNLTSTWDCVCTPTTSSSVIIQSGNTVSLAANTTVNNLTIESGATMNALARRLTITGDLINNGSYSGTNRLNISGSGNSVSGTGSWSSHTGDLRFNTGSHTIESDVTMVKSGNIQVRNNAIILNFGSVETSGSLVGQNANSSWYNLVNSTLKVGLNLLSTGKLFASSNGNTVSYTRTGTNNQNIKNADGSQYYNLVIDGNNVNSDKILTSNIDVLGDLFLTTSTFDVSNNNYTVNLYGDWNNTGGNFDDRAGTVILKGTSQNINHPTEETFNNLQTSSSGTKLLNTPIIVVNDLTIDNSTTLNVNSAQNNQLNVQGNIVNNGTLSLQKAMLLLDGSATQTIDGSFNMYDVIGTNSAGITMNTGALTLENSMQLTGNTAFNTNGSLTYLSNSTQTAYLKELAAGNSVSGNVTVQRYLNEGVGYYMLGAPVTGSTLADWNNEIIMTGFTGSNFPNWQFGSVYSYSESSRNGTGYSSGYIGATNVTNALNPGDGWFVYLFSNPITADLTGPLQQGTIATGSLSYTAIGATAEQGWHLMANPYASPILWNDVAKTNIQASEAYVRRSDIGGNYWAVNGDNIDTIYSAEGFWTQVGSGGGSLIFDEADKIDAIDNYNAKQSSSSSPTLPLVMKLTYGANSNYFDYSVLQFGDTSNSSNFDGTLGESRKIGSSVGTFPNIGSYAISDSSTVYYNSLNPNEHVTIPLKIWTQYPSNRNENYSLKFDGIEKWNQRNHCLILVDTVSNDSIKLDYKNSSYYWSMHDAISDPVLFLDHSTPIDIDFSSSTCFGSNDGSAKVIGSGSVTHDYTWTEANGDTVLAQQNHVGWSQIPNLKAGKYYVTVSDNGLCGDMGAEIVIEDGDIVISSFTYQNTQQAGEVLFSNTSVDALSYEWDFGDGDSSLDISPTHIYKSNDLFEVRLIAKRETCADTSVQTIEIDNLFLSVADRDHKNLINIYLSGDQIIIEANFDQSTSLRIEVINTLGQQIDEYSSSSSKIFRQSIPRPDTDGVYLIRVHSDNLSETEKVLVE